MKWCHEGNGGGRIKVCLWGKTHLNVCVIYICDVIVLYLQEKVLFVFPVFLQAASGMH